MFVFELSFNEVVVAIVCLLISMCSFGNKFVFFLSYLLVFDSKFACGRVKSSSNNNDDNNSHNI